MHPKKSRFVESVIWNKIYTAYKDGEISSLKYENKKLKEKIKSLELYVEGLSKSTS